MSDSTPTRTTGRAPGETRVWEPAFLGALRGMWLFTWKSQLRWQPVSVALLMLVVLPLLIYFTVLSPKTWVQDNPLLGDTATRLEGFARRLAERNIGLRSEQRSEMLRIFVEEYARANQEWARTGSPEMSVDQKRDLIRRCYARIDERAQTVLDDEQFAPFQAYEGRRLDRTLRQVTSAGWKRAMPFYRWVIDFYFFIILPLNCVRVCGALVRDDLQADTLGFLTTRPVTRARLLLVKYLSQTAWLQIVFLIEASLLFVAGSQRQIPELGSLLPLFLATQFLAVFAWSALGAFLGLVARRYIALALVYGLIVEMGIGRIPTNINALSLMRHLKTLLAHNATLEQIYAWPAKGLPLSVGALVLATGIFLGLAVLLFTFREYHHNTEMQK